MEGLLTIDARTVRARRFAAQIMGIIEDCVSDKDGAMSRLIQAAYKEDVEIIRHHVLSQSSDPGQGVP
jgi:hypothetical protein